MTTHRTRRSNAALLAIAVLGVFGAMRAAAAPAAAAVAVAVPATTAATPTAATAPAVDPAIARGRYLVRTSGCNDCHTPGYAQNGGTTPESEWLTGVALGWQGPWGTTYASNLRLSFQNLSERQWLASARAQRRPPMPWYLLRDMNDADLRAIYRYVRASGPKGEPVPTAVAPGGEARTPFLVLVPQFPKPDATTASAAAAPGAAGPARGNAR